MCIMVTDGAPWKDAYPDGNDSPKYSNMKWVNTKKRNFYYTSFFFFFNSCFQLALFTYSPSISKNTLITSSFFLTYINYIWNFFLLHTLFFSCNEIILFFCYYYQAQKEVKLNGIETVGVYLRTGGNAVRNQIYTYCISSCYDKTVHGKALGLDGNGKPIAYDFDKCQSYMNSLSTSARTNIMVSLYYSILKRWQCLFCISVFLYQVSLLRSYLFRIKSKIKQLTFFLFFFIYIYSIQNDCEFYIDGNVQNSADLANIKVKVNNLVNAIAAASYTVSTTSDTVLKCDFANAINGETDLCANDKCLQVNREAWVRLKKIMYFF